MLVGKHLDAHVMDEAGDKICLFGFARGAYTARALAGMLHKVGLLSRCNHQQVPFAYRMFTQDDKTGWTQSKAFKKTYSIDVDVEFVGVWDTVNSVGIIPRRLPFTKANDKIRYFRHAISLDEHRAGFKPSFYHQSTDADKALGVQKGEMPKSCKHPRVGTADHEKSASHGQNSHIEMENHSPEPITQTNVEEVWFAGCHRDVGGGSVTNNARYSLARISLRWMIREIFKANVGILFHGSEFKKIGLDPAKLYHRVHDRPPAIYGNVEGTEFMTSQRPNDPFVDEETEDLFDALSPIYDQLKIAPQWWILELLPRKQHYQRDEDDMWAMDYKFNMGKGRRIRKQSEGVKLHRTVKIRMEANSLKDGKYSPRAKIKVQPMFVD
ncbi:hypothetical protein ID866_9502 [Astraeus odoratus]|nr:hypothetical protein ID866_9502 [Astraeus odoratus]